MNVTLFYQNISAIDDLLVEYDVIPNYTELIPLIVDYRTTPTAESKEALDEAIDDQQESLDLLFEGLSQVPHSSLLLENLHAPSLLAFSDQTLKKYIYDDLFNAHEKIQTIVSELQALKTSLSNLVLNFKSLKLGESNYLEQNLFTVEFLGDTDISDLKQLMEYSKKLELILYSYACTSADKSEYSPKIYAMSKSSPVTIDISWLIDNLPKVLELIGLTVLFYLNKKDESLKYTQVEQLVLQSIPAEKQTSKLKDELTKLRDNVVTDKDLKKHVNELVKSVKNKPKDRTASEQKEFLMKGVTDLIALLDEGARVEVFKTDSSDDSDEKPENEEPAQTTLIYTKYKQIEQKTKLLQTNVRLKLPASDDTK